MLNNFFNFSLTCPFIWVSSSCAYNYTDVAHWPRLNFIFAKKYPQIRSDNHKDIMMIDDAVASFSTKFLVEKKLIKDHLHHFTTLERKKSVYIKGRLEKRKKRQQNEMLQSRTLTETLFITPKYLSHFNLCESAEKRITWDGSEWASYLISKPLFSGRKCCKMIWIAAFLPGFSVYFLAWYSGIDNDSANLVYHPNERSPCFRRPLPDGAQSLPPRPLGQGEVGAKIVLPRAGGGGGKDCVPSGRGWWGQNPPLFTSTSVIVDYYFRCSLRWITCLLLILYNETRS